MVFMEGIVGLAGDEGSRELNLGKVQSHAKVASMETKPAIKTQCSAGKDSPRSGDGPRRQMTNK